MSEKIVILNHSQFPNPELLSPISTTQIITAPEFKLYLDENIRRESTYDILGWNKYQLSYFKRLYIEMVELDDEFANEFKQRHNGKNEAELLRWFVRDIRTGNYFTTDGNIDISKRDESIISSQLARNIGEILALKPEFSNEKMHDPNLDGIRSELFGNDNRQEAALELTSLKSIGISKQLYPWLTEPQLVKGIFMNSYGADIKRPIVTHTALSSKGVLSLRAANHTTGKSAVEITDQAILDGLKKTKKPSLDPELSSLPTFSSDCCQGPKDKASLPVFEPSSESAETIEDFPPIVPEVVGYELPIFSDYDKARASENPDRDSFEFFVLSDPQRKQTAFDDGYVITLEEYDKRRLEVIVENLLNICDRSTELGSGFDIEIIKIIGDLPLKEKEQVLASCISVLNKEKQRFAEFNNLSNWLNAILSRYLPTNNESEGETEIINPDDTTESEEVIIEPVVISIREKLEKMTFDQKIKILETKLNDKLLLVFNKFHKIISTSIEYSTLKKNDTIASDLNDFEDILSSLNKVNNKANLNQAELSYAKKLGLIVILGKIPYFVGLISRIAYFSEKLINLESNVYKKIEEDLIMYADVYNSKGNNNARKKLLKLAKAEGDIDRIILIVDGLLTLKASEFEPLIEGIVKLVDDYDKFEVVVENKQVESVSPDEFAQYMENLRYDEAFVANYENSLRLLGLIKLQDEDPNEVQKHDARQKEILEIVDEAKMKFKSYRTKIVHPGHNIKMVQGSKDHYFSTAFNASILDFMSTILNLILFFDDVEKETANVEKLKRDLEQFTNSYYSKDRLSVGARLKINKLPEVISRLKPFIEGLGNISADRGLNGVVNQGRELINNYGKL